jgi:NAD(P)-dependent dehydrogenase (short-subunit alcohol dehydrogenase family)
MRFAGDAVLVSGAGSGIGRAAALASPAGAAISSAGGWIP